MGIKLEKLIDIIEDIANPGLAEEWDNCGMQINLGKGEIEKVLVTLEITKDIIREAKKWKVDFIVSHHPLFFHRYNSIDNNDVMGNYIIRLIQAGISVYSAHTTFDKALGGNNVYAAELIGLRGIRRFHDPSGNRIGDMMGRRGDFPEPVTLLEACKIVEKALKLPKNTIKAVGNMKKTIKNVGICTGAGSGLIDLAIANECDLFITGDIKYHEAQRAREAELCLIDAGHYGTEKIFAYNFAGLLRKKVGDQIEVIESNTNINPFSIG